MSKNFEDLKKKSRQLTGLEHSSSLLHWDQEVMMPEKGIKARSHQLSTLSGLQHQIIVSNELGNIIQGINKDELSQEQRAVYREIKRKHERARNVDQDLIEQISSKSSETLDKWKEARKEDDFSVVAEELDELVQLKREYANQINSEKEPYKVLFQDYEPYVKFETMEKTMEKLKQELTDLTDLINNSDKELENEFSLSINKELQMDINKDILDIFGFNWEKGRLDTSEHPFTIGNQFDARITTRVDDDDVSKTVMPTIHEFGHALYEQNLPEEKYGLPTGESRDLSVHESQSRLWENHIGRSESFWKSIIAEIPEFSDLNTSEAFESINRVKNDNLIRVEADELTYHLHIYLRYDLERKLVNGDIEVEELPSLWKEKMGDLLGVKPDSDKKGVLQDIHWFQGSIGYFTTYSLGSVFAAQIFESMSEEFEDLDEMIENQNYKEIKEWLEKNIHSKGKLYRTEKLIEKATGEKPKPDHFIDYIKSKYSKIYDIEL